MKKFLLIVLAITFFTTFQTASAFSDVTTDDEYYYAISYLHNNGIIQGYEDGTFKPDKNISRVEALKIILLSANIEIENSGTEPDLPDIENNVWYTPYVNTAVNLGIVAGYENNMFYPSKNVNFAEGLKILTETFSINYERFEVNEFTEYENWYDKYFEKSEENWLLKYDQNTDPGMELTRSDLAELIFYALNPEDSPYFEENDNDDINDEEEITDEITGESSFSDFSVGSSIVCRATYYGYAFAGNNTASGEPYDPEGMTAAHKELPFGTMVKVTNLANNKTVTVRINDRGPFTPGLEIDLSQAAFSEIAELSCGVLNVKLEIVES